MTIDPAACEPGQFLARGLLELRDLQGRALSELPLEVPVTVRPTVQLDPSVLLFHEAKPATVRFRSLDGKPFRITHVSECNSAAIGRIPEASKYGTEHVLSITPLAADRTLAVIPVEFHVQAANNPLNQRFVLKIQLPRHL